MIVRKDMLWERGTREMGNGPGTIASLTWARQERWEVTKTHPTKKPLFLYLSRAL